MSTSTLLPPNLHLLHPKTLISPQFLNFKPRKPSIFTPKSSLSDPFVLQIAETLEDSIPISSPIPSPIPSPLQKLRDSSSESLLSLSWPSRKDESFRFTDTSFIKSSQIQPVTDPSEYTNVLEDSDDTQFINLRIIDGFLIDCETEFSSLPNGVYIGSLGKLNSEEILKRVNEFVTNFKGDLFWSLNGVGAQEMVVIYVPEGCKVEKSVYLRYFSMKGSVLGEKTMPVSNPRVLVVVEKGGEVGIVEEYVGGDDDEEKCYWNNSVIEVIIGENGCVSHSYLQAQSLGAAHIKWTAVRQVCFRFYCVRSSGIARACSFGLGLKLAELN